MSVISPKLPVRREADVVWLTLNRPDVGNAIDLEMAQEAREGVSAFLQKRKPDFKGAAHADIPIVDRTRSDALVP